MDEKQRLYVPNGLKLRPEYFVGFGREEMVKTILMGLIVLGLVIGLGLLGVSLIACVVAFLVAVAGTVLVVIKDPVANISVVDQVRFMMAFRKQQKHYPYICHKFWLE